MPCAALAVELWRNLSVKTILLTCVVLVCCCVAVLQESLGLAWKTRHLRYLLRRREEGCYHKGGIDAIINITDRPPPPQPPPPLRKPLATFIIIIINRETYLYLQSAGVVNTHTHCSGGREVASHFSGVNCHNFRRNFAQAPVFSINPE